MQLLLEAKPGGRWYRDRGNGIGHLWGFVQVLKPPTLLELSGPMFMSYPAINHVEVKVEAVGAGCKVVLRHRAIGMIDPQHRKSVATGWHHMLDEIKKDSEQRREGNLARPADELDAVWKALSDATRRAILDFLRDRPRTTTEIVEAFRT